MSSLLSLVSIHGPLVRGDNGPDVKAAQIALSAAGYRIDDDGDFGDGTYHVVERFQAQRGLHPDGVIGANTAAMLDMPHTALVATAAPMVKASPTNPDVVFPHDDTASLLAFYGRPWADASLLKQIQLPFLMTYDEGHGNVLKVTHVEFHVKAADALARVFAKLWDAYGRDQAALDATRVTKFSGTFNYRPIRGSSRLSCHAFAAAIDLDAEDLPLGHPNPSNGMPAKIVDIFKSEHFFWGGDYNGRKDPMHFQSAHE